MEFGKFRELPIAPLLEAGFIEARLHTDGKDNIEQIKRLQQEYVGNDGLPNYIIVDPSDLSAHGRYEGIANTDAKVDDFVVFLNKGLAEVRGDS